MPGTLVAMLGISRLNVKMLIEGILLVNSTGGEVDFGRDFVILKNTFATLTCSRLGDRFCGKVGMQRYLYNLAA
ncbi:MAG: hypothetical protein AAF600_10740 [Bacteroidota bacterium]